MDEIEIKPSEEYLDVEILGELIPLFQQNKCVANARIVADRFGHPCVEGVALVGLPPELRYIRHCWNMIEGENEDVHFDVTRDYCFAQSPKVIIYYPVAAFNGSEYEHLPEGDIFLSNSPEISEQLNAQIDQEEENNKNR